MANYEETRYDFDGASLTDVQGLNTGIVIPWSSVSIPSGFLECDGTAVSRTTYSALFAVVGTTYGIGDGSTTFNIPDLTDRVCQHKSPTKALASTGGANTAADSGSLSGVTVGNTTLSSGQISSHTHPGLRSAMFAVATGGMTNGFGGGSTGSTGGSGAHTHADGGATFAGDTNSVLQPYLTLVYIIKT